jgi:serine phosphatase RsbU (regulator of sigma subunit)
MNENDQFLVYTDGVVDTVDENGMNYSVDVLKYNLMGAWFVEPEVTVDRLKRSLVEFRGNIAPVDDLTILMLKFNHRKRVS